MENFIAALVAVLFAALFAWLTMEAAQPDIIYPDRFHKAESLCENNKGMKALEVNYSNSTVYCTDGATFEFHFKSTSEV